MAKDLAPTELSCPFCGRTDDPEGMITVTIEERLGFWPPSQTLCLSCAPRLGSLRRYDLGLQIGGIECK